MLFYSLDYYLLLTIIFQWCILNLKLGLPNKKKGELMKNLPDQLDEIEFKMYEIECLVKCIRDVLDASRNGKEDYSYLCPIAEIACKKFALLTDDYSQMSSDVYRKFIVAE